MSGASLYSVGYGNVSTNSFPGTPAVEPRAPTSTDVRGATGNYPLGKLWIDSENQDIYYLVGLSSSQGTVVANWSIASGVSSLNTLTGDSGGAISPSSNNINILGSGNIEVVGSGSTLTITPTASSYPITPYVVGPSGTAGYQTIQSAIDAAHGVGGDQIIYIQPGQYTENLTFYDGIQLAGTQAYENSLSTTITGLHTPPTSGAIAISNVQLESSTHIFSSVAAGTSTISIQNATFKLTNGFIFNLPSWSGDGFNINNCGEASTNNGVINNSGGASIFTNNCQVGAGTGQTFTANGDVRLDLTFLDCPANISGGSMFINFALFSNTVTCSGTASGSMLLVNSFPTAEVAFVISSSNTITIENSTISTSNNPAISGTGTVKLINVGFGDSSVIADTVTVTTSSVELNGSFKTANQSTNIAMTDATIAAAGSSTNVGITLTPKGTGNLILTSGSLSLATAGGGLIVKSGSSARIGVATLSGGSSGAIANTSVTANTKIFTSVSALGTVTTAQAMLITRNAGVGFTITSADATDTSTVDWYMVEAS